MATNDEAICGMVMLSTLIGICAGIIASDWLSIKASVAFSGLVALITMIVLRYLELRTWLNRK